MNSKERIPCHIENGPFCVNKEMTDMMTDEYLHGYMEYIEINEPWVRDQTNDCILSIYHPKYLEAKIIIKDSHNKFGYAPFLIIECLTLITIIILLFIIIKTRTKFKEENETEQ